METAIYGRVSSEEQAMEGYSIRGQVEKLQSYVSAKSWSIYDVYLDEGISGKNITERPAIKRMIEDIKAGHVKNVLVFKLDRLTRSVADLVYLIDLFKQYGCAFNSLTESIDTSTASGRMFIKIIGIFAEFERENIGERVRLGKERKAREGYTTGAHFSNYGYDRAIGERIQTINETEAAIVRRVYDMYVNQNYSLTGIATTLNKEKIPTKHGYFWNTGKIISLISNPNYMGYVRYGMEKPDQYFEAKGKHEAIISEEVFKEAQAIMAKNKLVTPTKKPNEENYLVGFLFCGLCGRKLKSNMDYRENNKVYHTYVCYARVNRACEAKRMTAGNAEKAMIEYIANLPTDENAAAKIEQAKQAAVARIEELKAKLNNLEAKEKEMLDSYIEDNATLAEYRGVKTQLDGEKAKILTEIEALTPSQTISYEEPKTREEIITAFNDGWGSFTNIEKRQFLMKHIRKITLLNQPIKGSNYGTVEILDIEFNTN